MTHSAIQSILFGPCQWADATFGQIAKSQWADGDPHQPENLDSEMLKHASDMTILTFIQDDLQPGATVSSTNNPHALGSQPAWLAFDSNRKSCEQMVVCNRIDLYMIGFVEVSLWCEYFCSPFRIVGKQEQALGGSIEPTYSAHEGKAILLQRFVNCVTALFVRGCGDQPSRLVEHHVGFACRLD